MLAGMVPSVAFIFWGADEILSDDQERFDHGAYLL